MSAAALPGFGMRRSAVFDDSRVYRYELWRVWDESLPVVCFVALNPSTADEEKDDPTIRKEIGFARRWGCGGLLKLNAFALRSTDPKALKRAVKEGRDPVGPDNDATIARYAADLARIEFFVAAWGAHASLIERGEAVARAISHHRCLMCLGTNDDGSPTHPLYIPYERPMTMFRGFGGQR